EVARDGEVDLSGQHRGRGRRRARAGPGRVHGRPPRAGRRGDPRFARAGRSDEGSSLSRGRRARTSRGERARGGPRPVGHPAAPDDERRHDAREMKTLPRLLRYFGRYKMRALLALVAMAIVSAATVALLFLLKKVIDDVLGAGASSGLPGVAAASSSERVAPLLRWLETAYTSTRSAAAAAGLDPRHAGALLPLPAPVGQNAFSYLSPFP